MRPRRARRDSAAQGDREGRERGRGDADDHLQGADNRSVTDGVRPPPIDGLKGGDTVEITYTRERAIDFMKNR